MRDSRNHERLQRASDEIAQGAVDTWPVFRGYPWRLGNLSLLVFVGDGYLWGRAAVELCEHPRG